MEQTLNTLAELLVNFRLLDGLDILIVAFLVYRLLLLVRGTRAASLLRGIVLVLIAFAVSSWLPTLNYLLRGLIPVALLALVVIFQPELRMGLERLGRAGLLGRALGPLKEPTGDEIILEVVEAAFRMAEKGHGALIALERTASLVDIIRTGKTINGRVSPELIMTIFNPRAPLHDGAVVVRGPELVAASCVLPHSERPGLSTETGMRHRAALGLVERTDAVVVVVSEETGNVSLAANGTLSPALERPQLTERLMELFEAQRADRRFFFWRK